MNYPTHKTTFALGCAAAILLACPAAHPCSVPVFRYALERWPPDIFEVVVFHRGELSGDAKTIVEALEKASVMNDGWGNYQLKAIDLDADPKPAVLELWKTQTHAETPWVVLLYPIRSRIQHSAWSGPLTADNAKALVDSPVRRQVAKQLADGDVGAWVLLECGDQQEDDAAAKTLGEMLKEMEELIELPAPFVQQMGVDPDTDEADALRVTFNVLRLSRKDPKEGPFVSMLLGTEDDLKTFSEPIVFPVFGRGRALYALVGKGINKDNIEEACAFLAGPCSCQAKYMNPGTDILMSVDWDSAIMGELIKEEEALPLVGLSNPMPATPTVTASAVSTSPAPVVDEPAASEPNVLVRNAVIAVAVGVVVLAVATVVLLRMQKA